MPRFIGKFDRTMPLDGRGQEPLSVVRCTMTS